MFWNVPEIFAPKWANLPQGCWGGGMAELCCCCRCCWIVWLKITFKAALTTHLSSSSADFTYLAQVDPMEPFVCMWSAVCNICWMTGHFFSITVVHYALLKISSSKLNHMRLVLHNISGKREALGSVTADGRMEVEDWRWHLVWPQPWCVALAPNDSFLFFYEEFHLELPGEKKPYNAERDLSIVEN